MNILNLHPIKTYLLQKLPQQHLTWWGCNAIFPQKSLMALSGGVGILLILKIIIQYSSLKTELIRRPLTSVRNMHLFRLFLSLAVFLIVIHWQLRKYATIPTIFDLIFDQWDGPTLEVEHKYVIAFKFPNLERLIYPASHLIN